MTVADSLPRDLGDGLILRLSTRADAEALASFVEAFGRFVGRGHQQFALAGLAEFVPQARGGAFHLRDGAGVQAAGD